MSDASVERLANLFGAMALLTHDRLSAAVAATTGQPPSESTAVIALSTFLAGESQDALANVLGLSQSGVTRLLDRLAGAGLAERRSGSDARTRAVITTAAGARSGHLAQAARLSAINELLSPLSEEEQDDLLEMLEKMLAGATDSRAAARRTCRLCAIDVCGHADGHCPVTNAADRIDAVSGA